MKHFFRIFLILVIVISQEVFSQQKDSIPNPKNRLLTERFVINTGAFVSSKIIKVSVDGSDENDIIDFDDTFDINEYETTWSLDFIYRFSKNKKWSVGGEYFAVKNLKQKVLEGEIEWGDTVYPIGAKVDTGVGFHLYRIIFGRTISRGDKHELVGGLGVHAIDISAYMQATAYLGSEDIEIDLKLKPVSFIAPVPNIGFKYLYTPTLKWGLGARVDFFSLSVENYSGYLWNIAPSATYLPFKNVGIGISYRYFNISLKVNEQKWHGNINLLYKGPIFFLSFNF